MPNKQKSLEQVVDNIRFWEDNSTMFFRDFNNWANAYRMLPPNRTAGTRNFSNTRSAETARATETLASLIYRMMTAADPNFHLISRHPGVSNEQLTAPTTVLKYNQMTSQYKRRLMKAIRSAVLFGSVPVELPWEQNQLFGSEGPGFVPKSLLQFAFDPFVPEMDQSTWFATIDYVSNTELRRMALNSPDVWEDKEIIRGLQARESETFNVWIQERLNTAGYNQIQKGLNEVITWWGRPQDDPDKLWVISVLNRRAVVRMHESPYNDVDGLPPFEIAHFAEVELEAFGYGVGKFARRLQSEIDANRNRYTDLLTFSLFNMWEVPKSAGIDKILIRPVGILRPTEAGQIQPLRPDLQALGPGIELEKIFKEDFRALTGAVPNLQAVVTKATATESAIAQSEAVRKISIIAEIMAEPLVRRMMLRWHGRNMKFMDQPLWLGLTNTDKPRLITNADLQIPLDVESVIITDKDFRPQRIEAINFALQTLAALKQNNPDADVTDQIMALANELLRSLNIQVNPVQKSSPLERAATQAEGVLSGQNPLLQELAQTPPQQLGITPGGQV